MPERPKGAKKPRTAKYDVPAYLARALQIFLPPQKLTVSQWAEKYRVLDAKTSAAPGRWRNDKTPYMVGVMDAINDYEVEEVYLCACAQVGKSEGFLNMLGYTIMQDPSPVMVVYPTKELGEFTSKNRIAPMVNASKELRARYDFYNSQILELQFDGMFVSIEGSNSPSGLASKAIKYLYLDEVDKYPGASSKEADPISLARERTVTFATRKIYMCSTPTIKTGPIWKALESADVEKHYFVPCPHCGQMIELKFTQLRWPEASDGETIMDRADQAVYICQECACIITDQHKDGMLRRGEWRDVEVRSPVRKRVGFWINRMYSPFVRFTEIAYEAMRSKGDNELLQNFKNSWLALPWEDETLHTDADMVMERQTEIPQGVVPDWTVFLTAGVDVQETSFYWTIRAWGQHMTSQNIAHGQALSWHDIEKIMCAEYQRADGEPFIVERCFIDSGYAADEVYEFCTNNQDWAFAVKGSSQARDSAYTIKKIDRVGPAYGMPLVIVDGAQYKARIAARMRRPNGRGSWMVHKDCDVEYANQVTSEHKVNVRSGSRTVEKWVPKRTHGANHFLDACVYAFAAADSLGLRTLHITEPEEEVAPPEPEQSSAGRGWLNPKNDWIGVKGKWL